MSPYEFYKLRISSFLHNDIHIDELSATSSLQKIENSILPERKKEIKTLVLEVIQNSLSDNSNTDISIYLNQLLNTSEDPNTVLSTIEKTIKEKLEENIDNSFENSSAYERYSTTKEKLAQKYAEIPFNEKTPIALFKEQREKIDNDTSLSSLERQYLLISLKEKINRIISERTILSYQERINDLYLEIEQLNYELKIIKTHRQSVENQYAKYIVFSLFNENHLLTPKQENTTHSIPVHFVKETTSDNRDNLLDIVNALQNNNNEPIHLYIDMQGGNRTSGYVRNAVLSILTNQTTNQVSIEKIIATNFNTKTWFNEIVEETSRYKILDLASGMNAFIRYGKADIIQSYCEAVGISKESPFGNLVKCMIQIDDALSLCNMIELTNAIQNLRTFFSSQKNTTYTDEFSNIYQVLLDGIRLDYGKLLDDSELNLIELIKWALRKGFIQQALTLIEDKLPSLYFKKNWLSYKGNLNEMKDFFDTLGPSYEKRIENKIFYSLPTVNKFETKEEKEEENLKKCNELWWYYKMRGKNSCKPVNSIEDFKRKLSTNEYGSNYTYIFNNNIKDTLENTLNTLCSLPKKNFSQKLPFLYCKFRSIETYFENQKETQNNNPNNRLRSYSPEQFYYLMEKNDQFKYKKPSISFSILDYLGEHTYYTNIKTKKENKTFYAQFTLNLNPALEPKKETLEELFLLHNALKKERNCNNHASEKGIRLPKSVVANAIQVYIEKFEEIETFLLTKN